MCVTAVASLLALVTAQIRAFQIGWHSRDLMQVAAVGLIVLLALNRRIDIQHKVPFLIAAFSVAGIGGIGTLGMFAGMVFIFPISAVIMSIFYPLKIAVTFILSTLLFYGTIATGFCSGALNLPPDCLMINPRHWGVYIASMIFFFVIACVVIYSYRKIMQQLINQISDQRDELTEALKQVRTLTGLLPICASCKKVRNDSGYWDQLEDYIQNHSDAKFSHAICPDCLNKLYPELANEVNVLMQAERH
ncbi:hypothetical protein [Tichowtungia aerotolerans]|uniref:Uncharacterized protein n=1 Tax=Tichowtungia aerotolerans TaxID=2697043 RepID=A0A6P1M2N8_9BACT|nr:hypothetical protein [Tichowtungia aerotolerans]QHI68111.1 hypothetical protein GT409_01130 [Tichowtungia aerotolerans]